MRIFGRNELSAAPRHELRIVVWARTAAAPWIAILLAALAGCGGDGPTAADPDRLTAVTITTAVDSLATGDTASLTAQTLAANGALGTGTVMWTANPAGLVTLAPAGAGNRTLRLRALQAGTVTITATSSQATITSQVVIVPQRYSNLQIIAPPTLMRRRPAAIQVTANDWRGRPKTLTAVEADVTSETPELLAVVGDSIKGIALGMAALRVEASGATATAQVNVMDPVVEIELVFPNGVSNALRQAAQMAADRWEEAFQGAWPPSPPINVALGQCGAYMPAFAGEVFTGIRVYVFDHDDGAFEGHPGTAAAIGGPCIVRNGRTYVGRVYVKTAWSQGTAASDLAWLMIHELGHVLGMGTFDAVNALASGNATTGYTWIGTEGLRQYRDLGRLAATGVPMADPGHWSGSALRGEVMSPGGGTSLSAITLGALADIGYSIRLEAGDRYQLPSASLLGRAMTGAMTAHEIFALDDVRAFRDVVLKPLVER